MPESTGIAQNPRSSRRPSVRCDLASVERLAVVWYDDAVEFAVGRARFDAVVDWLEVDDDDPCVGSFTDTADVGGVHHDRPADEEACAAAVDDDGVRLVLGERRGYLLAPDRVSGDVHAVDDPP